MWRNDKNRYGLVSIGFHWAIALGIVGLTGLGVWMVGLTYYDPWYHDSLALHKAFGIVVLALALAKFGWRVTDRRPGFGPEVRPYERAGATVLHWLFNALMILVPVTGYAISTSEGAGIDMFGLFELPALLGKTERSPRPRHRPALLSGLRRHRPGRHTCRRRAQASFRRQGLDAEAHAEPAFAFRAARLKTRPKVPPGYPQPAPDQGSIAATAVAS